MERGFVLTDERLRTNLPDVYAVGDIVPGLQLAHRGFQQGIFVAEDIAGLNPPVIDETGIPRVTYCEPEVASVGLTEAQARERYGEVQTLTYDLAGNGKSQILQTQGAIKLVKAGRRGHARARSSGIHMVGARVGELIGEAQLVYNWDAAGRGRRRPDPRAPHPERGLRRGPPRPGRQAPPLPQLTTPPSQPHPEPASSPAREQELRPAMAFSVQMPALGESVTEGTVTRWLKQEGDRVEVDEPLLEVSTDKVDTEIPSPAAGVLERIVAGEDETVEVGGDLAVIGDGDGRRVRTAAADSRPPRRRPRTRRTPRPRGAGVGRRAAVREPGRRAGRGRRVGHGAGRRRVEHAGGRASGSRSRAAPGTPVTMPELGESVTEGTVTRWLKQVGDTVEVDEPLLEVSTDKVDTEIPSPVAGTLLEITVGEDETVEVGAELAVIGDASAPARGGSPDARARRPSRRSPSPSQEAPQAGGSEAGGPEQEAPKQEAPEPEHGRRAGARRRPPTTRPTDGRSTTAARAPYVTPLVRKLAAEHGVDLSTLTGPAWAAGSASRTSSPPPRGRAARAGAGAGARRAPAAPAAAAAVGGTGGPPAAAHARRGRPRSRAPR